jgi:hypothetical protein
MPARRSSNSSGVGAGAITTPVGKNGGTVLGNTTSAATPSASRSALRRSLSQFRVRPSSWRSRNGFLYFPRQASNSSRQAGSRYSRYWAWLPPAWPSDEMMM